MSLAGCYFLLYKIFDPKYSVVKRHERIRIWHKGNPLPPTPPPMSQNPFPIYDQKLRFPTLPLWIAMKTELHLRSATEIDPALRFFSNFAN